MKSKNLLLGYWNIRGRGNVVRNLLHYCNVPYEQKFYTKRAEWFNGDKYNVGLDFPNLPYIVDGDVKIAETTALLHYIAIKGNQKKLLGESDIDQVKVSEAISTINDLRMAIRNVCFTKGDFRKDFEELVTKGPAKTLLTNFEKIFEKRDWVTGSLTIADFWFSEQVDVLLEIDSSKLDPYPNILRAHKKFVELPQVKEYRQSDRFFKVWYLPENGPTWNNGTKNE